MVIVWRYCPVDLTATVMKDTQGLYATKEKVIILTLQFV